MLVRPDRGGGRQRRGARARRAHPRHAAEPRPDNEGVGLVFSSDRGPPGPPQSHERTWRSAVRQDYIAILRSFAAVLPRMSAFSPSLSDVLAKMWSTGWSCQG